MVCPEGPFMARNFLLLLAVVMATVNPLAATVVRVSDEAGAAVERFEAMYHTADHGYSRWEAGQAGTCQLDIPGTVSTPVDVLVRADGYATAIKRINVTNPRPTRDDATEVRVTLSKGQPVKLRLNVPEGVKLPEDFIPEAYPPQYAGQVRMHWQPVNQRSGREWFNFLNLRREGQDVFVLNVIDDPTSSFFIGIDHPGRLRFCELGPFTIKDVVNGELAVKLPRPAPIHVKFETGGATAEALPFDKVTCDVMWKNPDGSSGSYYSANDERGPVENGAYQITDLAPGEYMVSVRTWPKKKPDPNNE